MITSLYNLCLLITTNKDTFRVVSMQTDNTLFLGSEQFAILKEEELQKAYLSAKPRDKLSYITNLIFNRYVLVQDSDDTIVLLQKD